MKLFKFLTEVCIAVINANCDYFKESTVRKMIYFVHTLLLDAKFCLFYFAAFIIISLCHHVRSPRKGEDSFMYLIHSYKGNT